MAHIDATVARVDLRSVGALLRWAKQALTGSASASLDAQLLLGHVLGRERSWVLAHDDAGLSATEESHFRALVARRARGEPVAYLRGYQEWYGIRLEVDADVLVPRPETELVLEGAVRVAHETKARSLVDVGTGSGALAIGLAMQLPNAAVTATDISSAALNVAQRNIQRHGLSKRITVAPGNLLEAIGEQPDLVVANLPYLSDEMMASLDRDVKHEPRGALYGGPTGLELYRKMLRQASERGWQSSLVLEIDPRQADEFRRVPGYDVRIETDYAGHARVVTLQWSRSR